MRPLLPATDAVAPYLRAMDERRVYSNFGPMNSELEQRYAERFNVSRSQVVACANATLGLQGAAYVSAADRFVVPAWTFAATPLAVIGALAEVVFVDVRSADWQADGTPSAAVRAIMPVLPFGAELDPASWAGWDEVVVDAAASGGMVSRDLSWLPVDWTVVISLHATKVLGAGEGAIVVFGDAGRAQRFRDYIVLGFAKRRESEHIGTNAKLSEIAAAYALAALDSWEAELADWTAARGLVAQAENELGIGSVCSTYPGVSPYWIVELDSAERATRCEAALMAAGIGSRRWWPVPCTRMPAFVDSWGEFDTPVSDRLAATTLGLPFFRDLTATDVDQVVAALAPVIS
jgi:dTDP-4-amino-4,6-dideoxygalactose transaminase